MKNLLLLVAAVFLAVSVWGQALTGTRAIPSANYPTIKVAVDSLNLKGVGTGGVTFNVAAGHTETNANITLTTATASAANPIVFIKSGAGANPLITAGVGTSATVDGIIKIQGTDYVTFDGIDVKDPVSNTTATTRMEWGYAILMTSATDASQHITLVRCNITLQKLYTASPYSSGIYSKNHNATSTTAITPTSAAGVVSFCAVDECTISDVIYGINWSGYSTSTYYGTDNYFGYTTGNTITNFGGGATAPYGMYFIYQNNLKVHKNTVSGGDLTTTSIYGIYLSTGTNSNVDLYRNTVILNPGVSTSSIYGIYSSMGGTGTNNLVTLNRNTVTINYPGFTSATIYCIYHTASAWKCDITDNSIIDCVIGNGGSTATGTFYGIYTSGSNTTAGGIWNVNLNAVTNNNRMQSARGSGTVYGIYNASSGLTLNVNENSVFGNSWPSSGSAYCIYISNSGATTVSVANNSVHDISKPTAVTNILPRSGGLYGIYTVSSGASAVCNVHHNTVYNLSNTWGGQVMPYRCDGGASSTMKAYSNNAYAITSVDQAIFGIYSGAGANVEIYKNILYNMSAATGDSASFYGICTGSSTASSISSVYNNYVSDLKAPEANIYLSAALYVFGSTAGTTHRYYNNTVYLNEVCTSAGASSAALYANVAPTFDMRNNILVNNSTGGFTTAYWRSGITTSTHSASSNFNCLQAGTPSTSNLLYWAYDATSPQAAQTIGQFTGYFPQEGQSFSEVPPFTNIAATPYNLRLTTATATGCESGGTTITAPAITADYDDEARFPNPGYPNNANPVYAATAPDVGADEFGGIPLYSCTTPNPGNTVASANNLCLGTGTVLSLQNPQTGSGISYQWQSSPDNSTWTNISGANAAAYALTPTVSLWYRCNVNCQNGPSTGTSAPLQITFQNNILTTTPGSRCGTGTVQLGATANAGTVNWYTTPTGGTSIGTGSPFTTPVISSTTSYYAGPVVSGGLASVGATTNAIGTGSMQNLSHYQIFDVLAATNIQGVYVYPGAAGNVVLHISNSAGTVLTTITYPVTAGDVGLKTYIPVNYAMSPGTAYRMGWYTGGVTMYRNDAGGVYPYTIPGVLSITGNSFSATYYYYCYDWQVGTSCAGPRSEVVATVTPPPAFSITGNQTVCSNQIATLNVTSNIADYQTYVWSPATNLFTDAACTVAYDGVSSATTLYSKSSGVVNTYTCTANNPSSGCSSTAISVVTALPTGLLSASPESICISGTSVITLVPTTGWGNATFQWQGSTDGVAYSDIAGATTQNYTTPTLTSTNYYKLIIKNSAGSTCSELPVTILATNPQVTSTTPATRCGTGTLGLQATGTGGTLKWYSALTGGTAIGTGSSFTTPTISATTSYFVGCESSAPNWAAVGAGASTLATYPNPFYAPNSNMHTQHLITAAELTAAGILPGNLRSVSLNVTVAGTLPMIDLAIKIATTTATSMTAFLTPSFSTIFTSASYMPVTGLNTFIFSTPFYWDGVSNIVIDICHGNRDSNASMARTVKSDATSYVSSVKANTTVGTQATTVCADVATNLLTYSSRPQFTFQGEVLCSTARSEVIATVTPPPALTVTAGQALCTNEIFQVSVTSTLTDFDTYTWTPVAILYTDAACTVPYSALANATTVYAKVPTGGSYPVTCTATNVGSGCVNTAASTLTVIPVPVITSVPEAICVTGSAVLGLNPATGYGNATFQWEESSDNVTFNTIAGATTSSYTTPTLTAVHYYKVIIKNGAGAICSETVHTVSINNPALLTTTPGTRCGTGTVTLGATTVPGGTVSWYSAVTGGTFLGSGSSFTTPSINSTTDYYAAAGFGGQSGLTIPGDGGWNHIGTGGAFQTTTITSAYMILTVLSPITLATMDIYPSATMGSAFTIEARTGSASGTMFRTYSGNTTVVNSGTPSVAQTVNVNWELPVGTYYIGFTTNPNTWRTSATMVFPWTLPGIASMDFYLTPSYQYYFYNLKLNTGCEGSRTAVTATVTPAPAITPTATPSTVCAGTLSTLNVTSSNGGYTYLWAPGNLSGATQLVYPEANTTYSVTATDPGSGCVAISSTNVTVTPGPSPITITPAAPVITPGSIQQLSASGGLMNLGAVIGTGTTTNTSTTYPAPYTNYYGGAKHQMLILASELTAAGLTAGTAIRSVTFSVQSLGASYPGALLNFQIDMGLTTTSVLTSTSFLSGLTNVLPAASLVVTVGANTQTLATPFTWDGTSNLVVQTSYSNANSGTSAMFALMYNTDPGFVSTNWYRADAVTAAAILSATTPTGSGNARPNMTLGYTLPTLFAWSPFTDLYTDAAATLPYSGQNLTTVYSKPAATITYTATATSTTNGCTRSKNVTVTVSSPMSLSGSVTNVTCNGGLNGAISTTVTGGIAPLTYLWSNAATTANLTGIAAGSYSVTVTDATASTVTGNWTVTQPAAISATAVVTNAACPNSADGAINLTVSGGTPGYTFIWSNGSTNEDLAELNPGSYTVTVTDATPCTKVVSFTVNYTDPVCNYTTVTGTIANTVCHDAHITITASNLTVTAPAGNLTLISAQNILVQPHTAVQNGAYAHFYISNTFCNVVPPLPAVQATGGVETDGRPSLQIGSFNLFPNPTSGNFTLVQKNDRLYGSVKVEVYGMNGNRILTESMTGEKSHEFGFSTIPAGLYFVKIIADDTVETIKLVKTR